MSLNDRCQRWMDRRHTFRPAGELFDPNRFGVEVIAGDNEARDFVEANHYEGTFPSAVHRFGLYYRRSGFLGAELVGVAVFGVGANEAVIPCYAPGLHPREGLELSRLVLRDETGDGTPIAGNAETWMLGRVFDLLRQAEREKRRADKSRRPVRVVLAYSDPIPRRTLDGRVVMPGHIGSIYQAFSGRYIARATSRIRLLTPNGQVINERGITKILAEGDARRGKGSRYVYEQFLAAGMPTRKVGEEPTAYVDRAIAVGLASGALREVKHPGNLVYGWPLTNAGRDALRPPTPYPTLAEFGLPVDP